MQYQHGGDVYSYMERFPEQAPLDFSANINPRGIPASVKEAMHAAIDSCTQYPDPHCRALRHALGERWALEPQCFFCANGAAEIFYRLAFCLKPQSALLTAPTFGEYEAALTTHGCTDLRFHILRAEEQFQVTDTILEMLTDDLSMLVLCNPNNPTGCTIAPQRLEQILARCQANRTWVILDECFADFLCDAPAHEMRAWLERYDRLVIVRAFTKMYAIPGVRLGWCMTRNQDLIAQLEAAGQPWGVSVIAQACGVASLQCTGWEAETAQQIRAAREKLTRGLQACGVQVFPGEANYLLFYTNCTDLQARLASRGIMIRDCSNYRGLNPGYFRAAVKHDTENEILIQHMTEVLKNGR